jgi:hypothetical protein
LCRAHASALQPFSDPSEFGLRCQISDTHGAPEYTQRRDPPASGTWRVTRQHQLAREGSNNCQAGCSETAVVNCPSTRCPGFVSCHCQSGMCYLSRRTFKNLSAPLRFVRAQSILAQLYVSALISSVGKETGATIIARPGSNNNSTRLTEHDDWGIHDVNTAII